MTLNNINPIDLGLYKKALATNNKKPKTINRNIILVIITPFSSV